MIFEIDINNKPVKVKRGETIKSVLDRIGINVPTLCSMKEFTPTGMCRMCVVEVEGRSNLIPSCSFKVEEWMKIKTHSPRVIRARKTIVELLLANHPDDCLYCERNGTCELQQFAEDLHVRDRKMHGDKNRQKIDKSGVSILREPSKCILCGRCIRVCKDIAGVSTFDFTNRGIHTSVQTAMNRTMGLSNCINCGQCLLVCPTAALTERIHFSDRETFFHDPNKKMIALYSTSVAQTISDEFGLKPGKDITGIITAILRKIGFDIVINSGFGTDILIMEQAKELVERLKNGGPFPMFSSCCQAWVKYMEQFKPELLPNISNTKSAQQIMGSLIKSYFADQQNLKPDDIYTAAIMPCTAKKFEAMRPEMTNHGVADVDAVITTRELIRMIRMYGIDVPSIEPEPLDNYFTEQSSVGKLVNVSGGTAEAILRTAHFLITNNDITSLKLSNLRGSKPVKYMDIALGKETLKVAAVNGMSNIKLLFEDADNPFKNLHYVEVMACPGGCIAGGGQPKCNDETIAKMRTKAIYEIDEKETLKAAHKNKSLLELYKKYLGEPLDPNYYTLLHTTFSERQVLL